MVVKLFTFLSRKQIWCPTKTFLYILIPHESTITKIYFKNLKNVILFEENKTKEP